ncbi:hypothetical protein PFISCL1PPCAC_24397, partial [Pristionchus fissidentatus]
RGRPTTTRSSTSQSWGGFPDEDEIYYRNCRLERERAGADGGPPNENMRAPNKSDSNCGGKWSEMESDRDVDGPPIGVPIDETTASPPKRLLQWPRPQISNSNYSTTTVTGNLVEKPEKSYPLDVSSRGILSTRSQYGETSKRKATECVPLVARTIDPTTLQVHRSSEKTPLLLRIATRIKAEETRFVPSIHQGASLEKVVLHQVAEHFFATPFIPPSTLCSTHIPLYLAASERRRALVHPIKTREVRSIRLIIMPPLHYVTMRTNDCGAELLTAQLLLSPLGPYRARRLRPIWETLVPLHASGHHVAVPFTLQLVPPFTVHRIATRVQKLQEIDARTLYRHSPIFILESARSVHRESARLATVEKEDPQIVRLIHIDQLFHARMTTRATVKVKRTEVYDQGNQNLHESNCNNNELPMTRSISQDRPKIIPPAIKAPICDEPSYYEDAVDKRTMPVKTNSGRYDVVGQDRLSKRTLVPQSKPQFNDNSGHRDVMERQPTQQLQQFPAAPIRESERRKKSMRNEPNYEVFVRDAAAQKERRGDAVIYDQPGVKESSRPSSNRLPLLSSAHTSPSPQEVTPPTDQMHPFDDFSIPSRPLPTMASLPPPPAPRNQNHQSFLSAPMPAKQPSLRKSLQMPAPLPPRPSSAETLSAEVTDQNKIPRQRMVLPPPPPNVPLAPKSAESLSQEPLAQPKIRRSGHPQAPEPFQSAHKAMAPPSAPPSSQPMSDPPSFPIQPPRKPTNIRPQAALSTITSITPNATSVTPAPSKPKLGPLGYINIIQPSSDAHTPTKSGAPLLPVADGAQKSSSSGNKPKGPRTPEGSDSGGAKHKMVTKNTPKKEKKVNRHKKSGSNKKSKFGPRGHEQMEKLNNVRLVADAVKAGEIEADPNTQSPMTRLIKKATTPLGGKKKKKKKSGK